MVTGPLYCAHCGALIDPPYTARRRYCNITCRNGAWRARRSPATWEEVADEPNEFLDALDSSLAGLIPPLTQAPLDDQIVRAILETRGLVGAFRRLGVEAQPKLS
ncbi:MAG: hypothetical protein ACLQUT_12765 [Thermoleophilia bacterium]